MSMIDALRDAATKRISATFAALGISGSQIEAEHSTRDTKAPVHVETPIVTHAPSEENIDRPANGGNGGQGGETPQGNIVSGGYAQGGAGGQGGSGGYGGDNVGSVGSVQGGNIYGETAYGRQSSNEAGPTSPAL